VNGATPDSKHDEFWNGNIPWATPEDLGALTRSVLSTPRRAITKQGYNSCGVTMVPAGSLILSIRAPVGYIAIAGRPLCTNQGCRSLTPKRKMDGRYFYYVFRHYAPALDALSGGSTFKELSASVLADVSIPEPSLSEQQKIAHFLDYQTANIDNLIAKKKRLLEILNEKMDAMKFDAVSMFRKNPDEAVSVATFQKFAPAHWNVKQLKFVVTFQRGYDLPDDDRIPGPYPVVGSGGIIAYHNKYKANAPTLVTGRYGSVGRFFLIQEPSWPLNTSLYSKNMRNNDPDFLWILLSNLEKMFQAESGKSAVSGIDRNDIHVIPCAVPKDVAEQKEISKTVVDMINQINNMKKIVNHGIDLLSERKQALISAAVTGQIDVRDWEPPSDTTGRQDELAEAAHG
jgi:type I restriction enzyme S subunit